MGPACGPARQGHPSPPMKPRCAPDPPGGAGSPAPLPTHFPGRSPPHPQPWVSGPRAAWAAGVLWATPVPGTSLLHRHTPDLGWSFTCECSRSLDPGCSPPATQTGKRRPEVGGGRSKGTQLQRGGVWCPRPHPWRMGIPEWVRAPDFCSTPALGAQDGARQRG